MQVGGGGWWVVHIIHGGWWSCLCSALAGRRLCGWRSTVESPHLHPIHLADPHPSPPTPLPCCRVRRTKEGPELPPAPPPPGELVVVGEGGGHGWHPPARPQSEKPAVHLTVCSPFLFSCRSALHIVLPHSAAPLTPAKAAPPHSPASPFALPCLLAPPPHPPPPPAACRARAPRARCQPQQDPADWQPAEEHCLCQAPHCPRARWLRWL